MSIRAQLLVSHIHPLESSPKAHFPPRLPLPTCRFELERSLPVSIMSNRAQSLISHLRRQNICLPPHHVNSSRNARLLPPPRQFGPDCSSTTPTVSIRARSLVSCLHHVPLSLTARLPPKLCQFEPDRSCPTPTVSTRARLLVSLPHSVNSSPTARASLPACQFERNRSSPASATSFQA